MKVSSVFFSRNLIKTELTEPNLNAMIKIRNLFPKYELLISPKLNLFLVKRYILFSVEPNALPN